MATESRPILVAGVGNIFLGDDAFGVEVVRRFAERSTLRGVRAVDFGIRGLDLAYALLDNYELVIMVDATVRGEAPGTLYTLQPDIPRGGAAEMGGHGMDPVRVLALAAALGGAVSRVIVIGCEPTPPDPDLDPSGIPAGLSEPVARAIEPAVARIEALIDLARWGLLPGVRPGCTADDSARSSRVPGGSLGIAALLQDQIDVSSRPCTSCQLPWELSKTITGIHHPDARHFVSA